MDSSKTRFIDRLLPLLFVAVSCFFAWKLRFTQDDAYISYRYAENFCNGMGLLFNPECVPVEGYTNFLWVILISVGIKLGVDPPLFSVLLSLCFYPLSLWLTYRLGLRVLGDKRAALLSMVFTGTNYTYLAYASGGGLETQFQSFLFLLIVFFLAILRDELTLRYLFFLSIAAACSFLVRMDSALMVGFAFGVAFLLIIRAQENVAAKLRQCIVLGVPALLIAASWLIWKMSYYESIFPNTYYAKQSAFNVWIPGLFYVFLFFVSFGLFLLVPIAGWGLLKRMLKMSAPIGALLFFSVVWMLYVIKVGGDFMEFRFMVPIIPFLFILISWMLNQTIPHPAGRVSCLILLIVVSVFHGYRNRLYGVHTIKDLRGQVYEAGWSDVGKTLGEAFKDSDITISTTAAGVIPYYAQVRTIDMLGLSDAWVAKNGVPTIDPARKWLGPKPGHKKKATLAYLISQKVNLMMGHPYLLPLNADREYQELDFARSGYMYPDPAPFPEEASVLEIPISDTMKLAVVYMIPHPAVEQAILDYGWKRFELRP